MTTAVPILVVEDDRTIREGLASSLRDAGYAVEAADGIAAAERLLAARPFSAVLLDAWATWTMVAITSICFAGLSLFSRPLLLLAEHR